MINKDKKDEEKKEERKIIDKIVRLFLKDDDFDMYIKKKIGESRNTKYEDKKIIQYLLRKLRIRRKK